MDYPIVIEPDPEAGGYVVSCSTLKRMCLTRRDRSGGLGEYQGCDQHLPRKHRRSNTPQEIEIPSVEAPRWPSAGLVDTNLRWSGRL